MTRSYRGRRHRKALYRCEYKPLHTYSQAPSTRQWYRARSAGQEEKDIVLPPGQEEYQQCLPLPCHTKQGLHRLCWVQGTMLGAGTNICSNRYTQSGNANPTLLGLLPHSAASTLVEAPLGVQANKVQEIPGSTKPYNATTSTLHDPTPEPAALARAAIATTVTAATAARSPTTCTVLLWSRWRT